MIDYIIGWAINTILTFISLALKNPASKAAYKKALLKVRDAINALYITDDETPLP